MHRAAQACGDATLSLLLMYPLGYVFYRAGRLVLLLAGGDKNSQMADIARARALIERLETDK